MPAERKLARDVRNARGKGKKNATGIETRRTGGDERHRPISLGGQCGSSGLLQTSVRRNGTAGGRAESGWGWDGDSAHFPVCGPLPAGDAWRARE
uniref:Uncharacterized protein n=1 Tax=Plectus sambesii TaxID=2011161 RepID=A0A914V6D2_9BILA